MLLPLLDACGLMTLSAAIDVLTPFPTSVIITSIIRIIYIQHLQDKMDYTWHEASACIWS